MESEQKT